MKKELPKWLRSLIMIIFLIGFFPFFSEIITVKAVNSGSLFSIWSILALGLLIIFTEIDIYTIANPPKLSKSKIAKKILPFNIEAATQLFSSIKDRLNSLIDFSKLDRFKKLLISLGYIGMFLSAVIPGFGRVGNGMYARGKKQLPLGRLFLYGGCLVRFLIAYGGIHIIIF